jgi:hypothetical protein
VVPVVVLPPHSAAVAVAHLAAATAGAAADAPAW